MVGLRTTCLLVGLLGAVGCGGNSEGPSQMMSAQGGALATGGSGGVSGDGKGGGAAGGATNFVSSLPGGLILGALSDAQIQQLCEEAGRYYTALGSALQEGACRSAGISAALIAKAATDAEVRESCQGSYASCIAQPIGTSSLDCNDRPDSNCSASVAEYAACLDDSSEALRTQLNGLPSCQSLTAASLPALAAGGAPGASPACATFVQKCPAAGGR